ILSDRAEAELGWVADTPLREGVRRYAAWVQDQQATGRSAATAAATAPALTGLAARLGVRRVAAMVGAVAANPAASGAIALIAVLSAAVSVILGAREEAQAADFSVLGLA